MMNIKFIHVEVQYIQKSKKSIPDISVPLKSGQININQTIPEKGKN